MRSLFGNKKFVYHVVFDFKNRFGGGRGCTTIYRKTKIKTVEDVRELKSYIEKDKSMGNVVIENWIRLKNAKLPEN